MTITNAIKKAEKMTGEKIQTNSNNQYWVEFNRHVLSFHRNGGYDNMEPEASCFYTHRLGESDDYQSDYFCGIFHDNMTQAIRFITRR